MNKTSIAAMIDIVNALLCMSLVGFGANQDLRAETFRRTSFYDLIL